MVDIENNKDDMFSSIDENKEDSNNKAQKNEESSKIVPDDEYDLQKELEAKFDELFGPIDDDND